MSTEASSPPGSLPDNVQVLQQLLQHREAQLVEQQATIAQLQREKEGLSHRLDLALRRLYGRSSEKLDAKQLLLFGQAMQESGQAVEALAEAQDAASEKPSPKRGGHGRRPLPADLPRHRIEHPLSTEELTCPCCDQARVRIGEEVSEQLDYTPASLFVIQHVRPKFACPKCEDGGVATAEKPAAGQVIDKGLPGRNRSTNLIFHRWPWGQILLA